MNRLEQLREVAKKVNRKYAPVNAAGTSILSVASDIEDQLKVEQIPTGNPAIDGALGGGLLRGTMSIVSGREGSGKTCFSLDTIAFNQKKDPDFVTIFASTEGPIPYYQMINAGVDLNRVLIMTTSGTGMTGENVLEILMALLADITLVKSEANWKPRNLADLVVLDSIAALLPSSELNTVTQHNLAHEGQLGRQAAMLSKFMRIFFGTGSLGKTHMMMINQKRSKMDSYGGETMPGGNAVLFYPKMILDLRVNPGKDNLLWEGEKGKSKVLGQIVKCEVVKNNTGLGFPHAKPQYEVRYGVGVDPIPLLFDLLVEREVIGTTGAGRYQFDYDGQVVKYHGKDNIIQALRDNEEVRVELEKRLSVALTNEVGLMAAHTISLEEAPDIGTENLLVSAEELEEVQRALENEDGS